MTSQNTANNIQPTEAIVKNNRDTIWKEHDKNTFLKFREKIFYFIFKNQFSNQTVYKNIKKYIKKLNKKDFSIIECGCGSGYIQKKIYETYNSDTYFLDISQESLHYARKNLGSSFDENKTILKEGSLFNIPYENESFDIVWNSGVLEHFVIKDQKIAIQEMLRVTKKGGYTVIIIPSLFGKIYHKMKLKAERDGTWQVGYECPLFSMKDLLPMGISYEEYSVGYISQLHYLKYLFKNKIMRYIATFVLEIVQRILAPLENRPGYFLICAIKK